MTKDLFSLSDSCSDAAAPIAIPDGEILLFASLFSPCEASQLFETLRQDIQWRQEQITLFGRVHKLPRLTAWYGEPNIRYSYSGLTHDSLPWIPSLISVKERIERVSGASFNSVLLNRYRDGADSMSWHADDEPELGRNPVIGSVSLGQTRVLQLKHKSDGSQRRSIPLAGGSLLLMRGSLQHHWLHRVAKSRRQMGERINLTYRFIA